MGCETELRKPNELRRRIDLCKRDELGMATDLLL